MENPEGNNAQRWDNIRFWMHPGVKENIVIQAPLGTLRGVTPRPCTGLNALTYPGPNPGGNIIMLCAPPFEPTLPTAFLGTWSTRAKLKFLATSAREQIAAGATPSGLDIFSALTSKTLIHELMHAVDFGRCQCCLLYFNAKANCNI